MRNFEYARGKQREKNLDFINITPIAQKIRTKLRNGIASNLKASAQQRKQLPESNDSL
jgi:hypothetical protein